MNIEYIDEDTFILKLNESDGYSHHMLEYDKTILRLINKKYVSYDKEGYIIYLEYTFEILNNKPTKIKIKFDFDKNNVEYVNINNANCYCLIL